MATIKQSSVGDEKISEYQGSVVGPLVYSYRVLAVLLGYCLFALGYLVFVAGVCFPLLLLPIGKARRQSYARKALSSELSLFRKAIELLGLFRVRRLGIERINSHESCLFVANHPGLLDAFLILSYFPEFVCLVKRKVYRNPFLWIPISTLGFVCASESEHIVDRCADEIMSGSCLLLFPEGGRSFAYDRADHFARGAAAISIRAGVPVVPIVIRYSRPFLGKQCRWWDLAGGFVDLVLELCYPILPEKFSVVSGDSRNASISLTNYLERLYRAELESTEENERARGT